MRRGPHAAQMLPEFLESNRRYFRAFAANNQYLNIYWFIFSKNIKKRFWEKAFSLKKLKRVLLPNKIKNPFFLKTKPKKGLVTKKIYEPRSMKSFQKPLLTVSAVKIHILKNVQNGKNLAVIWDQGLSYHITGNYQMLQNLRSSPIK